MILREYIGACASTLMLASALTAASAPDNRDEVRQARVVVTHEVEAIYTAIRDGMDLSQLSPMELALLRGDASSLLAGIPLEIQRAASDAAGGGMGSGVHVDDTHGVLTAWRYTGSAWVHAGYSDPKSKMSESEAFAHALSRPSRHASRARGRKYSPSDRVLLAIRFNAP